MLAVGLLDESGFAAGELRGDHLLFDGSSVAHGLGHAEELERERRDGRDERFLEAVRECEDGVLRGWHWRLRERNRIVRVVGEGARLEGFQRTEELEPGVDDAVFQILRERDAPDCV